MVIEYTWTDSSVSWTLVKSGQLKKQDAGYTLTPDGDKTKVKFDMTIDLSIPMPGFLLKRTLKGGMETATDGLRKQVLKVKKAGKPSRSERRPRLSRVRLSWPLIGRTEEMGAIEAAISAPAVSGILVLRSGGCREESDRARGVVGCRVPRLRNPLDGRHIVRAGNSARRLHRVGAVGCQRHRSVAAG